MQDLQPCAIMPLVASRLAFPEVAADWDLADHLHVDLREAYVDPATLRVADPPALPVGKVCGRMSEFTTFAQRADRAGGVELFGMMNWSVTKMVMLSSWASSLYGNRRRGTARSLHDLRSVCRSDRLELVAICSHMGLCSARFNCGSMKKLECRARTYPTHITTAVRLCCGLRLTR